MSTTFSFFFSFYSLYCDFFGLGEESLLASEGSCEVMSDGESPNFSLELLDVSSDIFLAVLFTDLRGSPDTRIASLSITI
jgi:hypothetical protein